MASQRQIDAAKKKLRRHLRYADKAIGSTGEQAKDRVETVYTQDMAHSIRRQRRDYSKRGSNDY